MLHAARSLDLGPRQAILSDTNQANLSSQQTEFHDAPCSASSYYQQLASQLATSSRPKPFNPNSKCALTQVRCI